MGGRRNPIGFQFLCLLVLILGQIQGYCSLNDEGLALLEFRASVSSDPFGALANWNLNDHDPCAWNGIYCVHSKVQILDLHGLSLEGTLAPALSKLTYLRYLVLRKNHFYGTIPQQIGGLAKLELLDLRDNNLSGKIPPEVGRLQSLKHLLLCDNKFESSIPGEIKSLKLLSESQFDENLTSTVADGIGYIHRKFGNGIWRSSLRQLNRAYSLVIPIKGAFIHYLNAVLLQLFKVGKGSLHSCRDGYCDMPASSSKPFAGQNVEIVLNSARRRLLGESSNLLAAHANSEFNSEGIISLPITRSSGSFPAIPTAKTSPAAPPVDSPSTVPNGSTGTSESTSDETSGNTWVYFLVIPVVAIFIVVIVCLLLLCRKQGVRTIGPWKTGLSGQLQKAFITGVPKLNRSELETACEDFSNIIENRETCTVYKGTLSSGVEIAVVSTKVTSSKEWSKNSEMSYRKKIDILSRINHKNFVNLIGFCEENEPFSRMMVFEYAPNGSLFEHLHVKEMEHLDWSTRIRIIMGIAYCLQYMHHDLIPPLPHTSLNSHVIYLTDDYASKVAENCFLRATPSKQKVSGDDEEHSVLPPLADPETNVHSFGILLLEIISGKLPYSEEQGPLEKWAAQYLNDKRSISYMIDPSLKSFKNNELDVICEVIQECIHPDPRHRPTMKDVTSKLREVITISPDQAVPRLSPLWWAELEILSVEAT